MKRLAVAFGVLAATVATPALADSNITCNSSGNVSYCGGTQDGVFYSYNCTDYGYELDCTLVSPYYYHWTINRY